MVERRIRLFFSESLLGCIPGSEVHAPLFFNNSRGGALESAQPLLPFCRAANGYFADGTGREVRCSSVKA
jgi:hypothetical protein